MGQNPSYDDLATFFASYAEFSVLYDAEAMSYYGGSNSSPDVFPPQLRNATVVITSLVSCGHLPTSDDLEIIGVVAGGGDLIFDALARTQI
jgi:hypothetical protein